MNGDELNKEFSGVMIVDSRIEIKSYDELCVYCTLLIETLRLRNASSVPLTHVFNTMSDAIYFSRVVAFMDKRAELGQIKIEGSVVDVFRRSNLLFSPREITIYL